MKKLWISVFIILIALTGNAQFEGEEENGQNSQEETESVESNVFRPTQSIPHETTGEGHQEGSGVLSKDKKNKMAQAGIDEITDKNYPEIIDSFEFNNANINDVIKAVGELTGKNFIVDPHVKGTITIIAPSKITVAEAYKAFLSALAINHLTVVPSGSFYKIKPSREARKDNLESYTGDYFPNSDQMITRIVHLKHISAEQIGRELESFRSQDGDIRFFKSTNSLIIADYGSTIDRIMKVINELDVPGFEEKMVIVKVNNASAREMSDMINRIVSNESGGGARSASNSGSPYSSTISRFTGAPSGPSSAGAGNAVFMVVPDERTNSLLVLGNKQGVERVKKIVKQLDFKINNETNGGVHVYYVKYGEAEKIAQTLSGISKDNKMSFSGMGGGGRYIPPPTGGSGLGAGVSVVADKDTNSLIISASKSDYDQVLNLLEKIDIPRDQVYVETVILEMLLDDEFNWGIGYYAFDKKSNGLGRVGFAPNPDLFKLGLDPLAGVGSILSFASKGETFKLDLGNGKPIEISTFLGLLNFLKGTGRTNVLSTPQVMALDNEEAEIEVGDEVAVGKDISTTNGIQNIVPRFKKATIKLKIKPFISPTSDSIRMKIVQDITQPESKPALPDTVTLSTRSVSTNIVVPDGDTAVLGGLVKNEEQESVSKVPLLGDIPILGWLFKARKVAKTKTNLFVFITPKIIRSMDDSQKLLDRKINERLDFIKRNGGRDPFGQMIDDLPRRKKTADAPTDQTPKRNPSGSEVPLSDPLSKDFLKEITQAPPSDSKNPSEVPVVEPPPMELLQVQKRADTKVQNKIIVR